MSSTEAVRAGAAPPYRPHPAPPSWRWARAALGLRVLSIALLAWWFVSTVARVVNSMAFERMRTESLERGTRWMMFGSALNAVFFLILVPASSVGLLLFAAAPRTLGIRGLAYAAAGLRAIALAQFVLGIIAARHLALSRGHAYQQSIWIIDGVGTVIAVTYVSLVMIALRRSLRALSAPVPRWFTTVLIGWIVTTATWPLWRFFTTVVGLLLEAGPSRYALDVFGAAANLALTVATIALIRRVITALRSQSTPE